MKKEFLFLFPGLLLGVYAAMMIHGECSLNYSIGARGATFLNAPPLHLLTAWSCVGFSLLNLILYAFLICCIVSRKQAAAEQKH